jgi:metallo-beta-lactamase family protein
MKIHFCGALQTVTGSQFVVSVNGTSILLDCGMFQGRRQETYDKNKNFLFDPSSLSMCILSHAHMDHSGNIPNLVSKGFGKSIYATQPTVDLCKIMLKDSAYLQQRDVEWVNKIRARDGTPPVEPLYTLEEVNASLDLFVGIDYDKTFTVGPGVEVTFRDAGHILGSASILLEIEEKGRKKRLGYTGDIGRQNMPIMHDPNQLRDLDILIMECTYGNRLHTPYSDVEDHLARLIIDTAKSGGKVIIPSFAVGRTQLIVYILHKLFNENRIPDMPVFVDSPMACHATEVFRSYLKTLDRETERIFLLDNEDPFGFTRLKYVDTVEESKSLNSLVYPHIIISASGMAEGGRILHHLRNSIDNHRALVLFVGFAAKDTLARKIMEGEKKVRIFGEEHTVKCKVETIDAFSAHADRHELLKYVDTNHPNKLKDIFLVHGELYQIEPFRNALRSKGYQNVRIPSLGDRYTL